MRNESPPATNQQRPPRRRVPLAQAKRRFIIDAAEKLFASHGVHQTTIADISGLSRVHETSMHRCFKKKGRLLVSFSSTWFDGLTDEVARIFSGIRDPYERLLYLLRGWALDFRIRESETYVLILKPHPPRAFCSSRAYKNTTGKMIGLLMRAIRA